jgi:dihydroneopterin aldolase
MGLIQLENMEFYAYHGHYKEEQIVGSKFLVSLSIKTDLTTASKSDNLIDTVNYHKAYLVVKEEMNKKSNLIENTASRILDALYKNFPAIAHATVKISKINPPIGGKVDCVSVTLERDSAHK